MNKAILIGRLTRDPDVKDTKSGTRMARYTLAVDRRFKREGEPDADFINCIVFNKGAEFAQNWLKKGTKVIVTGRIQTGSYEGERGKVYTTDIIVEEQEFAESKKASAVEVETVSEFTEKLEDDFVRIPDTVEDDNLPFN